MHGHTVVSASSIFVGLGRKCINVTFKIFSIYYLFEAKLKTISENKNKMLKYTYLKTY